METEQIMQTSRTVKKPKRKAKAPLLNYDIVSDVLNKKADITVGNLMVAASKLRAIEGTEKLQYIKINARLKIERCIKIKACFKFKAYYKIHKNYKNSYFVYF
jgi:hypothetical protein